MRWKEFNEAGIKWNHLTKRKHKKLYKILKDKFKAYSNPLKSLGHINLIDQKINFTANYPIKALPFPIPQALQAEAKDSWDGRYWDNREKYCILSLSNDSGKEKTKRSKARKVLDDSRLKIT